MKMEMRLLAVSSLLLPPARAFFMPAPPMTMRVSGIESTPNPCSFKFDLDEGIASSTSRGITYSKRNSAEASPEIHGLLELEGVESVYALADWLCLNKKPSAKWDAIVPAAMDVLGGPADSFDPTSLMTAAPGGGGGASLLDGIAIRLQVSNGIPIQVEACPPGGTPLRRKLSARFVDAMAEFVSRSGDEMAFFKGRQWLPRGVRYPDDDRTPAESAEEALTAAATEVEHAFHESRLRGAVADAVAALEQSSRGSAGGDESGAGAGAAAALAEAVRMAAAELQSTVNAEVVAAVDRLCALAGNAPSPAGSDDGTASAATRDAFDALVGFAGSGVGPVAARRSAVAYIGGVGEAAGKEGLEAVAAVFRGDKSPGVRRTAGDALSDLGDPGAVPIALTGLRDKSKLVRWRAARVVGELATREQDAVSLDEAREGELEFEVAFEMSDAARKIRYRVEGAGVEGGAGGKAVAAGPVWKQIQERGKA